MSLLHIALGFAGVSTLGLGAMAIFAPALLANIAKSVVGVLSQIPPKGWIAIGAGAVLLVAVLYVRGLQGDIRDRDATIAQRDKTILADIAAMKTMTTSLDGALSSIDGNNARIDAAHTELERERQEAATNEAALNERYKGTQATVAGLEAAARRTGGAPCTVSQEAAKALEGL